MARNSIGTTFSKTARDAAVDFSGGYHRNIAIWFVHFRANWGAISSIFSDNAQLVTNTLLASDPGWFKADQSLRY
jgi:hypothetical protein